MTRLMTSHRTMTRALLFLAFFVVCFGTSSAYDLNHVPSRHRRQSNNNTIIEHFLKTLEKPNTGLIIMADRSKYISNQTFYTAVTELMYNILRYHVPNNKVAILTFANKVSEIYDGFKPNSNNLKCQFFEGQKEILSSVIYEDVDEEPDYKKSFVYAERLSFDQSPKALVILVVTAGDKGGDTESNLWFRSPTYWLQNINLFVATTNSSSANASGITSVKGGNYAPVSTWISALKEYKGGNVQVNIEEFNQGDASCNAGSQKYCNPYTGSSICTNYTALNPQPIVMAPTSPPALDRLVSDRLSQWPIESCHPSSCKNGRCLSPHGPSICYCHQGYIGTNCEETICKACKKQQPQKCDDLCAYGPKSLSPGKTLPQYAFIIPCAVGGFIILLVTVLLICVCCRKKGGGGEGGTSKKKKKTPPPPPDASLKPIGLVVPTSRPQRLRETTPEEDNLYAHYGKIPRHQNMAEWLGYIEEMVTIGHMEAAAIIKFDTSEWVCSERAFKVNQKEYDVLGRLLNKQQPNYKVKFKRKEYFLIENDGETLVMESLYPRGEIMVVLSRTTYFLIAVKVTRLVGLESAKNEVEWIREVIKQQEL